MKTEVLASMRLDTNLTIHGMEFRRGILLRHFVSKRSQMVQSNVVKFRRWERFERIACATTSPNHCEGKCSRWYIHSALASTSESELSRWVGGRTPIEKRKLFAHRNDSSRKTPAPSRSKILFICCFSNKAERNVFIAIISKWNYENAFLIARGFCVNEKSPSTKFLSLIRLFASF